MARLLYGRQTLLNIYQMSSKLRSFYEALFCHDDLFLFSTYQEIKITNVQLSRLLAQHGNINDYITLRSISSLPLVVEDQHLFLRALASNNHEFAEELYKIHRFSVESLAPHLVESPKNPPTINYFKSANELHEAFPVFAEALPQEDRRLFERYVRR